MKEMPFSNFCNYHLSSLIIVMKSVDSQELFFFFPSIMSVPKFLEVRTHCFCFVPALFLCCAFYCHSI